MRRSQLATTTSMQKISEKEAQKETEVRDRFGKLILFERTTTYFRGLTTATVSNTVRQ